ncbi:MAG: SUMF1/EgtB/PvdO family nonheme iron enzyme, partial [Bacteroidota bacterium]
MERFPLSLKTLAFLVPIFSFLVSLQDRTNQTINTEMILIEGGTFTMGHDPSIPDDRVSDDEMPAHEVTVPTFYLGKYEVTNAEFVVFLNDKGSQPEGKIRWIDLEGRYDKERCHIIQEGSSFSVEPGFERYPVNYLSWHGAMAYVYWLKEKTGLPYRLPTEAEWEYAAKGGAQATKPYLMYSGSDQIEEVAWYSGNSGYVSHEVGSKKPNALGLYDMSGNMLEWCWDVW